MEEWDIQYKELLSMPEQSYRLIDIRDEASMSYGMIPGAEGFRQKQSSRIWMRRIRKRSWCFTVREGH